MNSEPFLSEDIDPEKIGYLQFSLEVIDSIPVSVLQEFLRKHAQAIPYAGHSFKSEFQLEGGQKLLFMTRWSDEMEQTMETLCMVR